MAVFEDVVYFVLGPPFPGVPGEGRRATFLQKRGFWVRARPDLGEVTYLRFFIILADPPHGIGTQLWSSQIRGRVERVFKWADLSFA